MRSIVKQVGLSALAVGLLAGCGAEQEAAPGVSLLGPEVEADGWVDAAHTMTGDGATRFESYQSPGLAGPIVQPWRPYFREDAPVDGGARSQVVGDHLLSLSRFRGLVSTRVAGADAPRVDATVPLSGLPVGLFLSGGVAAVLVVDAVAAPCVGDPCRPARAGRLVLVDVQDPANPRVLGESAFEGTVYAARLAGGTLHVLIQEVVDCVACDGAPSSGVTWLEFDRSAPLEVRAPRLTLLSGSAFFRDERLFVLSSGATSGTGPSELRVADLSVPEATLSEPLVLGGVVDSVAQSGDRLLVTYSGSELETFGLESGTPISLGRGRLDMAEAALLWPMGYDGDRAVTLVDPAGTLAVIDLADPNAPQVASRLALDLAEGSLVLDGNRVLAMGRSTLAVDAREDPVARGPQALVLVDLTDAALPRVADRVTLGSFDSGRDNRPELRGNIALATYSDPFPTVLYGGVPEGTDCGRSKRRVVGYDVTTGRLAPSFAFDGLDADSQVQAVGNDWWATSSVSVSHYLPASGEAPVVRSEITQSVITLRGLSEQLALFGVDFASNAATLELVSTAAPVVSSLDVATTLGLPRVGCDERRRWGDPVFERQGKVYALRFHSSASDAAARATATLHVLDTPEPPGMGSPPLSVELEPLAEGEYYLGAVQTDRALLVARGRQDAASDSTGYDPLGLFTLNSTDPTLASAERGPDLNDYGGQEGQHPGVQLAYDVYDLSGAASPVRAAHLDIDPALATGGFLRSLRGVTRDTAWGLALERRAAGPAVVSGSVLVGQHAEPTDDDLFHFYLDRFDFTDPARPQQLDRVEIPGSVLDFDAASGGLLTLETVFVPSPGVASCRSGSEPVDCRTARRVINGLVVDGQRATRVGRLLLDTEERSVVSFAVSNGSVYYATRSAALASDQVGPFAPRTVSIERVVLRDGYLQRMPSLDVGGASSFVPEHWQQFAAKGDRAAWVTGATLVVANFAGESPTLEAHDLGPWGCSALELRGDTAYCAQGQAGYMSIPLGAP